LKDCCDNSLQEKKMIILLWKLDYFGFTPDLRAIKYAANIYVLKSETIHNATPYLGA